MKPASLVLLLLAGCGGGGGGSAHDGGGGPDAALPDGSGDDAAFDPDPADASVDASVITRPELPVLTPCPSGWRPAATAVGAETVMHCEPYPGRVPDTCGPHAAHFPGEQACRIPGTPCTADTWATGLPATGVIYVDRRGRDGAGTRADPARTIASALALATSGSVIALSKGSHDGQVIVPAGVTLWGACVAETTITTTSTPVFDDYTVIATGAGVGLRNLAVTGIYNGIEVAAAGSLTMNDVLVADTGMRGVVVNGGTLDASDIIVRDTSPANGVDEAPGSGLAVRASGQVALRRAVFLRNRFHAIDTYGAARAELADVAVLDTKPMVTMARTVAQTALYLSGTTTLTRAFVRVPGPTNDDWLTVGKLSGGVTVTDTVIRDSRELAIWRAGATPSVVARVFFEGGTAGLKAFGGADVRVSHFLASDLHTVPNWYSGEPALSAGQATIQAERVAITGSELSAVSLFGSTATMSNLTVVTTRSPLCGSLPADDSEMCPQYTDYGVGVAVAEGAYLTLSRFYLVGNGLVGLMVGPDANADLHLGSIASQPIGISQQNPGLDFRRLADQVIFSNDVNLDSSALPLPPRPGPP